MYNAMTVHIKHMSQLSHYRDYSIYQLQRIQDKKKIKSYHFI